MVVMFYKVTANTELVNSEPLFLEENIELGSCEPWGTIFLSNEQ